MNIDHLTYEELLDLNRMIVARLKLLAELKTQSAMMNFRIGQKVRFDTDHGEIVGTLVRHNRKTVGIVTDAGERWNVSPHLLRSAEQSKMRVIDIGEGKTG